MGKLNRKNCAILPLVLKSKWYNLIEQGVKKEEYRTSKSVIRMIQRWWGEGNIEKDFAVVEFRRGYRADAPRMAWIVAGVYLRKAGCFADPEMGEPTDITHYALELVERVELEG